MILILWHGQGGRGKKEMCRNAEFLWPILKNLLYLLFFLSNICEKFKELFFQVKKISCVCFRPHDRSETFYGNHYRLEVLYEIWRIFRKYYTYISQILCKLCHFFLSASYHIIPNLNVYNARGEPRLELVYMSLELFWN